MSEKKYKVELEFETENNARSFIGYWLDGGGEYQWIDGYEYSAESDDDVAIPVKKVWLNGELYWEEWKPEEE